MYSITIINVLYKVIVDQVGHLPRATFIFTLGLNLNSTKQETNYPADCVKLLFISAEFTYLLTSVSWLLPVSA